MPACCLFVLVVSCNSTGDEHSMKRTPTPLRDINKVMEDHSAELMAIPGVIGVAISELDDHTPCIWVMVKKQSPELEKRIPKKLEGHPVVIHESGEIKPVRSS